MSNVWDNVRSGNISSNNTTSNNKSSTIWSSIRNTNNTNTNTWFKKANGNVIQNIAGTIGDVGINTYKGFFNTIEGGVDAGEYNLSDIMNKFGNKKAADYLKWSASVNSTGSLLGENENNKENLFENKNNITKKVDNYSILGDKSDSIVQGVGNVAAFAGLSALAGGAVGAAGKSLGAGSKVIEGAKVGTNALNTFSSAYGNARSQAYNDGADEKTAKTTAFISGLSEAISEQFFDAIPGVKSVGLGDKISSGVGSTVEKVLKNQQAGKIAVKIMGSIGEGSEEIISNVLQATGNDIAHKLDNNYTYGMEDQTGNVLQDMFTSATSEASREAFISAAISSAIVNGGNTMINQQQKNKAISAYAKDNNITFEQSKTKLNEFYNENLKQIQQENPNPTYKENLDQQEEAQYNANQQLLKDKTLKKAQAYTYKETQDVNTNEINKSFTDAGFNDTQETHELVDRVQSIAKDQNVNIKATNNQQLLQSNVINNIVDNQTKALIDKGVKVTPEQVQKIRQDAVNKIGGYVTTENGKKTIYINGNSSESTNFLLGHEVTHILENSDTYNELRDSLYNYAKSTGIYENERKNVESIYANGLGNVDEELTSNLTGYLMMDESFIKEAYKKPTLFNTLYSKVKELYYKATGKQQKAQYEKILRTFRKVYADNKKISNNKTSENKTQLSLNENITTKENNKDVNNSSKNNDNTRMSMSNDDVLNKQYGTTLKDLQVDKSVLPFTSGSSNDITSQESALNNPNVLYQYDNGGNITEEDKQKRAEKLINDKISNNSIANIENTSKVVKNTLELTNNERNDFLSQINKYFGMTREEIENSDAKDIINKFVKNHSTIEYEHTYTDDLLDEVKQAIRGYKITLGDSFKGYNERFFGKTHKVAGELSDGITDFKKNNPGLNVSYGNNENIDVIWQELHSRFPSYFDEDVNDKDMLFQMASLLKKDSTKTETESYNLDEKDINDYSNKIYHSMLKNSLTDEELKTYISGIQDKINNKYARQMSVDGYRQYTYEFTKDLSQVKDKKAGISYKINTMKRNLRDIMSREEATKWYNAFFKPVTENNARIEIAKQYYVDKISKYKLNEQESSYVQMIGEKESNPDTTLTNDVIDKFYKKNENKIDKAKCESAVIEFRNVYDELINKVNSVLKANGYKTIDYRKGYFPHFIEEKNKNIIQKMAEKFLGWKTQNQNLPTDIAGITDTFKPGKVWTSFSQRRTGDYTDYNALKGMDNYLNGAMDVIFHTQDIQKLRALENQIRYQYSDSGVQAKIDEIYHDPNLSIEEKNQQIESYTDSITNNPLGNLVTELRNYTNNLANKKSFSDRSMEQSLGRNTYTIMKNINGRVSANMVGMNISSAMTNFIPITQAWGECSTKNIMRGIKEATINNIKDDGFSDSSVYLTNRTKQADKLYKTAIDKASDFTSLPFEAVDSFASNVIVRAKYYDNIDKGMNNIEAMNDADEYAKDIMAGRSKGDQPTIFNTQNPISKLFTAFQLEVNNQYGYMLKDLPVNVGKDAIDKLALAFLKMFLGAFLYNQFSEKLTGRKSAFSPIDIVEDDVINGENKDIATKIKDIAENIPFVGGVMGGGRLPISAAIPFQDLSKSVTSTASDISDIRSNDESKKKAAFNELISEWSRPLYYLALPFGGGQLKKTVEGLSMYDSNLPINGSYNKNGELKYEADNSTAGKIKSAIFGKNSTKNANEYYDNGYKPLNEKQIQTIKDSNISVSEYRNIQTELKNKSTSEKIDYISNLPLEDNQKNVLVNSISNRKEQLDVSNYNDYGSYDEFIYSSQNPEKYKTIKSITDYSSYTNYDKDISVIKTNATDKNTRKEEVFNYINKLSLNKYQKLMLYKEAGGYSIKNYKNEMFNYINSMELSKTDKETIYNELFS